MTADPRQVEAQLDSDVPTNYDDMVVALSFSGGGTRAAAFSYGVLQGFEQTRVPTRSGPVSLLDRLDFLSGVSGGSILAAYYGLKGREGYADFKERFLLANAEENLQTDLSLLNIARGLEGGVNGQNTFVPWLDAHLYNHATFKDLFRRQHPRVWINASDIYNRTAFIFAPVTFSALCSDLSSYPVSMAVAASAAVPVVFSPIVIQNFPGGCPVGAAGLGAAACAAIRACAAADESLCGRARALPQRRNQIRQAARWRPGRQFRPGRLHHRAARFVDA